MKHTHNGTCQVCGAVQAVSNKSGRLAKHGYTTQWGFFSGTCSGSDGLPFERSHDLVDESIISATARAAANDAEAAAERAETGLSGWHLHRVLPTWQNRRGSNVWVRVTWVMSADATGRERATFTGTYGSQTITGDGVRLSMYGDAADCAAKSRARRASHLNEQAIEMRAYVEAQRERLAGWAERPLIAAA